MLKIAKPFKELKLLKVFISENLKGMWQWTKNLFTIQYYPPCRNRILFRKSSNQSKSTWTLKDLCKQMEERVYMHWHTA